MKRFLYAGLLLCLTVAALAQTGTPQTKTQLGTETTTNFPDNTSGLITPLLTRQSMMDYIASWQQAARVNAQTSTSYNVTVDDYGKLVTVSNVSPVSVSLPQATGSFSTFNTYICNVGSGTATITPTTSTINGSASVSLLTGQCIQAVSDGTNYQIFPGPPPAASSFGGPGFNNCSLAASVGSNLLTVALKDAAGNDPTAGSPCQISFRTTTLTTGQQVTRSVTSALSINTNAVGATLASANSTAFRFWVVAFDNGGTPVLSLYNASTTGTCKPIDENSLQNSTGISGTATSAGVYYTPNGTSLTSKAIRILGFVEYNSTGLATAGTYASAPNFINMMGTGGKKPCDVIQVASFTSAPGDSTTTSTTYVATNTTASLTPTSATSVMMVNASAACLKDTASFGQYRLSRGTANNTNMFGGETQSTVATPATCYIEGIDLPNTASSQAYSVQMKSGDANTAHWGRTLFIFLKILELMG